MTAHWPAEAIWEQLAPLLPDFSVEILPHIDSTNSELMRRARAGQHAPILLVAEQQTAGRGRLGRTWHSGPAAWGTDAALGQTLAQQASLTFSVGMPLRPADWSGLSLAVGLSLVQSLHPDLMLKWPNDVWLGERKVAGILIETASLGELRYVVIGVGINVRSCDATGLRTPAAALVECLPHAQAPAVLGAVVPPLVRAVLRFEAQGFAGVRAAFHARDLLAGRQVLCTDGSSGRADGVDASGALLVHTPQGVKRIHSAEVSVRPLAATDAQASTANDANPGPAPNEKAWV